MNEVITRWGNFGDEHDDMATDDRELLDDIISIRVTERDKKAIAGLAKRLPIKRVTIARIALRIGLAALEKDPSQMLAVTASETTTAARTKAKPKRRRR